jgi:hypothetical protein
MTGRAAGVPGLAGPRHRHTGGVVLERGTQGNAALPCWRYPLWLCALEIHICVQNCRFCVEICVLPFNFPIRAIRADPIWQRSTGRAKAQRCEILAKNALFIEYVGRCEAPGLAVGEGTNDLKRRGAAVPRPVIPSLTTNTQRLIDANR